MDYVASSLTEGSTALASRAHLRPDLDELVGRSCGARLAVYRGTHVTAPGQPASLGDQQVSIVRRVWSKTLAA